MTVTVKKTRDNSESLVQMAAKLAKLKLFVGVTQENNARAPTKDDPTPPSNSTVGYAMEFGVPERNVPARPHLVVGLKDASDAVVHNMGVAAVAVSVRDLPGALEAMADAGTACVESVRSKIQSGPFEPLAPRTIRARLAKGNQSDQPLVDTGQYLNSVGFVIREG